MKTLPLFDTGAPQWDGEGRDPLDRYYTPEWATEELVKYMGDRIQGLVWEPCSGADMIGRVIRKCKGVERYIATDVDPGAVRGYWDLSGRFTPDDQDHTMDFLVGRLSPILSLDWIITNPPYTIPHMSGVRGVASAADFVRRALEYECAVAMLLRITWLEPCGERADIFRDHPPTDVLLLPRVQYLNGGSNNVTSAWVIWDPARRGQQTVRWAV